MSISENQPEPIKSPELMSPSTAPLADRIVSKSRVPDQVVDAILEALRGVKFGQITVTVQDGLVVQIDRMERRRLKS